MNHPKKKSPYRMGWLVALFDLPVITKPERKKASDFRRFLLEEGFIMLQYSVYARACTSADATEKFAERVKKNAPQDGNVRLMFFTDKQWEKTIIIFGDDDYQKNRVIDPKIPNQMEFW